MIKYNLTCKCGETFEGWFSSSNKFDKLLRNNLVTCVTCSSTSIKKSIMAPNLSNKAKKNFKIYKNTKSIKKKLLEFRKFVEKNFKYVGGKFAEEARSIHYDDKKNSKILS